jgi:WD40 repeat protein
VRGTVRAWSPDGNQVAVGHGSYVYVAEPTFDTKRSLSVPEKHELVWSRWSPDSKQIGACLREGTSSKHKLVIWQREKSDPLKMYPAVDPWDGREPLTAFAWSADQKVIALGNRVIDADTGKVLETWEQRGVACDRFPDDTIAAAGYENCVLTDKATGKELGRGFIGERATVRPTLSNLVATDCRDGSIRLWDAKTGAPRGAFFGLGYNDGLAIGVNGHYRGPKWIEEEIVYLVETEGGRQETYTPAEFAKKFGWKNDPEKVRFEP